MRLRTILVGLAVLLAVIASGAVKMPLTALGPSAEAAAQAEQQASLGGQVQQGFGYAVKGVARP